MCGRYASSMDPEDIVEDLLRDFPPDKFFVSVGLWRQNGTLDPQTFKKGLAYTMKSGAPNIWITPNELMSRAHWLAVDAALGQQDARMHAPTLRTAACRHQH